MASLKTILARTFFWSYERGTWQYDLAVIIILIFVLWHAAALVSRSSRRSGCQRRRPGRARRRRRENDSQQTYRIDARVLAPPEQTPALQNDLHNALKKALPDLRDGRFSILKIDAGARRRRHVIAYQVEIRR